MTANKPMTGEQLDELMTIAVNMQRDSEKVSDRPAAMFAYAVQVAVLELRKVRNEAAVMAAENAGLKTAIDATIGWQQSTDSENVESVRMLVDVKTPATDASLAEVRAQGVEMLTSKLQSLIDEGNFEGDEIGVIAGAVYTGADIAAQIRKGVQS
ncbi:hypothetical protein M7959_00890 [Enterobacter hormaechei subsp. xiangfangensis]|uniref:hypothetical protein n=1 Tax=Enterobacter cloacae complex TaxID=354276 RepID=UPI0016811CD5|nr:MULTISPECIES: hypothetical protein [Enterobacter cloacae complex]MBE4964104.1 hypothetical protein [Enterobacter cloacae complex sp. P24RS]MCL1420299.1 hypothetical protein [Enterobacter hormaechei]MCL1425428.1 hypothetical protein [Enterobacter hormaechei]MCM8488141.1 hypothetical protein [Enterobacter hormaechei]MCW4976752.1 hypothetical protein [Enterobacter hormaechei subsp. xiangfangensis]